MALTGSAARLGWLGLAGKRPSTLRGGGGPRSSAGVDAGAPAPACGRRAAGSGGAAAAGEEGRRGSGMGVARHRRAAAPRGWPAGASPAPPSGQHAAGAAARGVPGRPPPAPPEAPAGGAPSWCAVSSPAAAALFEQPSALSALNFLYSPLAVEKAV